MSGIGGIMQGEKKDREAASRTIHVLKSTLPSAGIIRIRFKGSPVPWKRTLSQDSPSENFTLSNGVPTVHPALGHRSDFLRQINILLKYTSKLAILGLTCQRFSLFTKSPATGWKADPAGETNESGLSAFLTWSSRHRRGSTLRCVQPYGKHRDRRVASSARSKKSFVKVHFLLFNIYNKPFPIAWKWSDFPKMSSMARQAKHGRGIVWIFLYYVKW
jgi:hypothetical protein